VKMAWYRTFIGYFLRWLWEALGRSGRGNGGQGVPGGPQQQSPYSEGQAQQQLPYQQDGKTAHRQAQSQTTIHRLIEMYQRSWVVPVVESSRTARFALAHPQPGSARIRAAGSAIALAVGMVFGELFILVPAGPRLVSAVPTPIWVVLSLALVLFALFYWRQIASCLVGLLVILLCIALWAVAYAVLASR
jgi:hypothetical protein